MNVLAFPCCRSYLKRVSFYPNFRNPSTCLVRLSLLLPPIVLTRPHVQARFCSRPAAIRPYYSPTTDGSAGNGAENQRATNTMVEMAEDYYPFLGGV